jgi:hypothetical protein
VVNGVSTLGDLTADTVTINDTLTADTVTINDTLTADRLLYSAPIACSATYAGGAFYPASGALIGINASTLHLDLNVSSSGVDAYAYLGIDLPNGATVTNLAVYGILANAAHEIEVSLYRKALNGGISPTLMAQTSLTTTITVPISNNTNTITNATIDRSSYSYTLVVRINGNSVSASGTRMASVKLDYTVPADIVP